MATGSGTGTPIGGQGVEENPATKAAILTFASRAWNTTFTGTQLDLAISACLSDLNGSDLLWGYTSFALAINIRYVAQPTNYKSMVAIHVGGAGQQYDPLVELPGGVRAWRYLKAGYAPAGRPQYYIESPNNSTEGILLYPRSDAEYTMVMDYWAIHPETPDDIRYPARFQHLLNLGTVYWEAVLRRSKEYGNIWGPMYFAERKAMEDRQMPIVRSVIG